MKRLCLASLVAIVCLCAFGKPVAAQVNVRGQILLPGGDVPREPIRFEITCTNGYHDLVYTDSGGRFILVRLDPNLEYTITVDSDDSTWGTTQYRFHPGETDTPRFYLNALPIKKQPKNSTVSVKSGYTPIPEAADLYDRGMKAYRGGQPDAAVDLFRAAIDKDPKFVAAYNDLAVVLLRLRKYPEAEAVLRKGLEQDAKSPDLQANLGAALNHQNHFAEAVAPLREALRLRPNLPEAHLQLGAALVEIDDLSPARAQLVEAQKELGEKAGANPTLQMYLGELYARTGDFKLSIEAFERYLSLAPDSGNSTNIKGLITRMQSELAKRN
jgi:tetratricopeptide (TPR) repeat protein